MRVCTRVCVSLRALLMHHAIVYEQSTSKSERHACLSKSEKYACVLMCIWADLFKNCLVKRSEATSVTACLKLAERESMYIAACKILVARRALHTYWLQSAGSLIFQVSFAKETYANRRLLGESPHNFCTRYSSNKCTLSD